MSTETFSADIRAREAIRRAVPPTAAVVVVVTGFLTVARADSLLEAASMVALELVVAGLLFLHLVPRSLGRESAGGGALALSVIAAVLLLPAFWSGLPMLLGSAGAMLGYVGRRAERGSGKAIAALGIGLLAVTGYLMIYTLDWIAHPGGSWFSS